MAQGAPESPRAPDTPDLSTPSIEEIEDALVDGDRPLRRGTARTALRQRTFRRVFYGAFASNIGTWMQNVILAAYAYTQTHSSVFVGIIIFAQLGPTFVFPMFGGLIADRVNRKRFLIILSLQQMAFSFVLALVVRQPHPSLVVVTVVVLLIGAGSAMFGPAYAAILPGLVGREDLPGAISLNAAQMNASRVIGPVIGGVAYHLVGPSWVFGANALTYLFVVAALMTVTLPPAAPGPRHSSRWRELTAGIVVAHRDPLVGRCLVTVFLFSLFALAFVGQMPVVAAHNLGVNPRSTAYGVLYACFGCGALLGAISVGTFLSRVPRWWIVRFGLLGYAASLTAFALLRVPLPAFVVVAVVGAFYFAFITALNTTLQARLDDAVRGRVMALWMMGFGGTVGLGNLIIGPVVEAVGITAVLLFGAGVAVILAAYADVRTEPRDLVGIRAARRTN